MAEEKDIEVERLRRLLAPMYEKREQPSRMKKMMNRLGGRKIKNGDKKAGNRKDAA
jgi:hypothetical protein